MKIQNNLSNCYNGSFYKRILTIMTKTGQHSFFTPQYSDFGRIGQGFDTQLQTLTIYYVAINLDSFVDFYRYQYAGIWYFEKKVRTV